MTAGALIGVDCEDPVVRTTTKLHICQVAKPRNTLLDWTPPPASHAEFPALVVAGSTLIQRVRSSESQAFWLQLLSHFAFVRLGLLSVAFVVDRGPFAIGCWSEGWRMEVSPLLSSNSKIAIPLQLLPGWTFVSQPSCEM